MNDNNSDSQNPKNSDGLCFDNKDNVFVCEYFKPM